MIALAAYQKAMQAHGVPQQPLQVYTSKSFCRVGLADRYSVVVYAFAHRDGVADIVGKETLEAMVAAFNAMLDLQQVAQQ